jgi:hypothetical protein
MGEMKSTAISTSLMHQKIKEIRSPQNKIIKRLQSNLKKSHVIDPTAGYSRMHHRHNRA